MHETFHMCGLNKQESNCILTQAQRKPKGTFIDLGQERLFRLCFCPWYLQLRNLALCHDSVYSHDKEPFQNLTKSCGFVKHWQTLWLWCDMFVLTSPWKHKEEAEVSFLAIWQCCLVANLASIYLHFAAPHHHVWKRLSSWSLKRILMATIVNTCSHKVTRLSHNCFSKKTERRGMTGHCSHIQLRLGIIISSFLTFPAAAEKRLLAYLHEAQTCSERAERPPNHSPRGCLVNVALRESWWAKRSWFLKFCLVKKREPIFCTLLILHSISFIFSLPQKQRLLHFAHVCIARCAKLHRIILSCASFLIPHPAA